MLTSSSHAPSVNTRAGGSDDLGPTTLGPALATKSRREHSEILKDSCRSVVPPDLDHSATMWHTAAEILPNNWPS
eukprot:1516871-Karenia_brevis.AAC.1